MSPYEESIRGQGWAFLKEIGDSVMEGGAVFETSRNLARRLEEASIPYAVLGALALGRHGWVRATVDINLLLTPEGLIPKPASGSTWSRPASIPAMESPSQFGFRNRRDLGGDWANPGTGAGAAQ